MHDFQRYSRCLAFLPSHQLELFQQSTIALVGLGGIGSHAAQLLTQLGPKQLRLVDGDVVEPSNLTRQALYTEQDVFASKALSAAKHLSQQNSEVDVRAYPTQLSSENLNELLSGADLVLDGLDNYQTRALVNQRCLQTKTPWVYAGAIRNEGMVSSILPGTTPCLACWAHIPARELTCAEGGILNTACALTAAVAVNEAFRILSKQTPLYAGKLWYADLSAGVVHVSSLTRKANCPACGAFPLDGT